MVAVVVVLLLGASRLPKIARSVGEARRELEKVRAENDDGTPDAPDAATRPAAATPTPPAVVAPVLPAAPPVDAAVVEATLPLPPPLPPPAP